MGPIALREFEKLVKSYNCQIAKTTKEWEVRDKKDGRRVIGFATISGRHVKRFYIDRFLKEI